MIRHTRLQNEPREYLERREELRRAELELILQREKVAALRRSLPPGTRCRIAYFSKGRRTWMPATRCGPSTCDLPHVVFGWPLPYLSTCAPGIRVARQAGSAAAASATAASNATTAA
jgi:hypothetical protein